MVKQIFCGFLCLLLGFTLTACAANPRSISDSDANAQDAAVPEPKLYVALGDSIARGYGLEDIEKQRYSTLLCDQLGEGWTVENYGVDGQTSGELLTYIADGHTPRLAEADLITVSIGANNLLRPASNFMKIILAGPDENSSYLADALHAFSAFLEAQTEGVAALDEDIPRLIEAIRAVNPTAQILFQTIYSPYARIPWSIILGSKKLDLPTLSDNCVTALNACIDAHTDEGYTVADVYTAFSESETNPVNATQNPLNLDPHPNADGHMLIAQTYASLLRPLH